MSTIIKWWAIAAPAFLLFYLFAVKGRVINWVGHFMALPGILLEVLYSIWLSIADSVKGLFVRKKKKIKLDEYERQLS